MVDLVITAADVATADGGVVEHGTAGASITAGQVVYLDEVTTGRYLLADTDSVTAAVRKPRGIALNSASDGQPLAIHKSGPLTIGAVVAAGVAYYLSGTPGGICPVADVAPGDYPSIIGMGISTTQINVSIQAPNVVLV